jgi:lipopolysaccharide export LptBFGC system permease protein LptF
MDWRRGLLAGLIVLVFAAGLNLGLNAGTNPGPVPILAGGVIVAIAVSVALWILRAAEASR